MGRIGGCLAILVIPLIVFSQNLAHYRLGENEILNEHIYTLLYSNSQQFYIGTGEGAYIYKNGKFRIIPLSNGNASGAVFGLHENEKGKVFCFNLAGDVFQVSPQGLLHITSLPKEYLASSIQMEIDDQDQLIFFSKGVLRWDKEGWEIIHRSNGPVSAATQHPEGRSIFFTYADQPCHQKYFEWKKGQLTEHSYKDETDFDWRNPVVGFLFFEQDTFAYHLKGSYFELDSGIPLMISNKVAREGVRQFQLDEVWSRHPKQGIRKLSMKEGKLVDTKPFLSSDFISAVYQSQNGTLFLGTFGRGVIVVPEIGTHSFQSPNPVAIINRISVDNQDVLYALTREGVLYKYKGGEIKELPYDPSFIPNYLFAVDSFNFQRNREVPSLLHPGLENGKRIPEIGSLKAIRKINDSCLIAINSSSILKRGVGLDDFDWAKTKDQNSWRYLDFPITRPWDIDYDAKHNQLYVADQSSLKIIAPASEPQEIFFDGSPIQCKSMAFHEGQMWCGTTNNGILIFDDKECVRQLSREQGLGSRSVKKILIKHGLLFVSHRSGFQLFNLETGQWHTLGAAEGVPNGSVQDFAVGKEKLWMLSRNIPISIDLNAIPQKEPNLLIHIDSVLLGGVNIDWEARNEFEHDKNRFALHFEVRGIDFFQEARLLYRVIGVDSNWSELDIHEEVLEFKSLSPGTFQLELKCEYRNKVIQEFIYRFTIHPPFWQRWWFYILIMATVLFASSLVFYSRIKLIRRRNAERLEKQRIKADLFESELKALRSQMNPHFIFNSLNAIQELLLNEDTDASYDYIVLFANLVRKALNHSKIEFISIEEELNFLRIYLSLEKLRFKEEFEYHLDYQGPEELQIPTLLVQPFIENAMLHGLLHRKGQKVLDIQFSFQEEQLMCTISDNGVGRKRAEEIQQRRKSVHQSFALDSIQKRLDILNQRYGEEKWRFWMEDLEEEGTPTGTRVFIQMPFIRAY